MDALTVVVIVAAVFSAACWVLSLITKDTSWVDRAWSIVPVVYAWIIAGFGLASGEHAARLVLMALLVTAWGARLTFNFARKGGYTGVEDYRWAILRGRMPAWAFQVFNLVFIIGFQMTLLVLITLPAEIARQHPTPLNGWDVLLAALFLFFLVGETIADQQQWDFHRRKKAGEPGPGFATTGLFRFSRHPNFFCEQAQWWVFYGFAVSAASAWLNWTLLGPVLLTALFIGSTIFTESITASKYPAYADYKRRTSMLVPWFPREPMPASA